jgi:O-antigen ligase
VRKVTQAFVWLFVFSLPWEFVVSVTWLGTVSRLLGIVAAGAGVATVLLEGRVRRPSAIIWLVAAFVAMNVVSLFWTIAPDASVERAGTYMQLLALVWLVWEFARDRREQEQLFIAFWCGEFVSLLDLLRNFASGVQYKTLSENDLARFSATGSNPNELSLVLVLALPIAWHLVFTRRGAIRVAAALYMPTALAAVLLTGSRGGFVAAVISIAVLLGLSRKSLRAAATSGAIVTLGAAALMALVPQSSWDRVVTIGDELTGNGTLSGRVDIWEAGLTAFDQQPLFGVGTGAFQAAVDPLLTTERGKSRAPHNVALAILVEQGIFGFAGFALLLSACGWAVMTLPPPQRVVWTAIALSWLAASMTMNIYYSKTTFLLMAMLAAQAAASHQGKTAPQ